MNKQITVTSLLIIIFIPFLSFAQGQKQKSVLIYTKNGEGYVHDNIQSSVAALVDICRNLKIVSEVSKNPEIFNEDISKKFDAVIFTNTNNEAFDNDAQREVFKKYIQQGGRFMGIHSATGSEREWSWFWSMIGGKFRRHPPYQTFSIRIIDSDHPATEFLPDVWIWEDECYYMDHLNPDIHVLLAADLSTIDDPEMNEYPGTTFGSLFPISWCHEFDGGKQFYTALGHNPDHYRNENFRAHLQGGLQWMLE